MGRKTKQGGDGGGDGQTTIPTDQLLTIEQVCLLAGGVSPSSIRRAIREGKFVKPLVLFGKGQIQRFCPIESRRALGLPVPGETGPGRRR